MASITRRAFLAGTAPAAATMAAGPSVHAQKKGGTLRFVPHADLKVLDPIWTTGYITRNHGYMVFDTLFAFDADLKVQPQMVDKWTASANKMRWTFTLPDGLKFHDGQPVTAEDCVASIKRWGARDALGRLLMGSIGKMAPVDKKTFAIDLEQPFGLVLEALGKPSSNVPFILPARLAGTDPNERRRALEAGLAAAKGAGAALPRRITAGLLYALGSSYAEGRRERRAAAAWNELAGEMGRFGHAIPRTMCCFAFTDLGSGFLQPTTNKPSGPAFVTSFTTILPVMRTNFKSKRLIQGKIVANVRRARPVIANY